MTREYIEKLNTVEPYCFETDREEQWFNVGLQYGLDIADSEPISPWISVEESLPKEDHKRNDYMSVEVLTITDKGYISLDTYDYQTQRWFIHSEFLVVDENDDSLGEVTHWMIIPEPPKE